MDPPARGLERSARSNASVEPLPLVPATWTTGGSARSGWPSAASSRSIRPSDRSMILRVQRVQAGEDPVARAARHDAASVMRLGSAAAGAATWPGGASPMTRGLVARSGPQQEIERSGPGSRAARALHDQVDHAVSSRNSARWKPSGSFSRMVCSMTRGPAKPISAPGSAIWMSPSIAKCRDAAGGRVGETTM